MSPLSVISILVNLLLWGFAAMSGVLDTKEKAWRHRSDTTCLTQGQTIWAKFGFAIALIVSAVANIGLGFWFLLHGMGWWALWSVMAIVLTLLVDTIARAVAWDGAIYTEEVAEDIAYPVWLN